MHPITLYGIVNCDTVKKARAWLDDQGFSYTFHDFKRQGLTPTLLDSWLKTTPWETLLNRKGLTWRKLDDAAREAVAGVASARSLMLAQPSIIKRPVVDWGPTLTVGFDADRWSTLLR